MSCRTYSGSVRVERAHLCRVVQQLEVCVRSVVLAFDFAIRACGTQSTMAMCNAAWSKTVYHNKQNTARKNGHRTGNLFRGKLKRLCGEQACGKFTRFDNTNLVVSCMHADKTCGLSTVTDDQQSKLLSELESIESACTRETSNW